MVDAVRHVLMTADAVGGVWDHALTLAGGMAKRGVRTTLAVMGPAPAEDQWARAAAVPGLDLRQGDFPLEWMPDAWPVGVAASGDWLLDLTRQVRPDVVHVNGYAHAALPFAVPVVCAAHSDVLSWFAAVEGREAPPEFDRYEAAVRRGLDRAAAIIAPSRAQLAALAFQYGVGADGIVIPNGVPDGMFAPGPKRPLILTVGRVWDAAKNIALLDRAAPGLGAPVVVAGDCRHPDGSEHRPAHVECLGRLAPDSLSALYAEAAIFCLPARYEPFGLAAVEAALSGCALVLGAIPSLREVWGDAALYVDPGDERGLRRALNGLLADAGRRSDMAARARMRAARYRADAMVAAYLDLYADVRAPAPLAAAG